MIITDPKPDSFHLQQHSVIRSSSSYHPLLNAFNATLSVMDNKAGRTPFASVELPAVHATADTPVDIDQTVQITDLDQYGDFAKVVLTSEEYTLAVDGKTDLHQSGLPATTVAYNKVARLKGMHRLLSNPIPALYLTECRFERVERLQRHHVPHSPHGGI